MSAPVECPRCHAASGVEIAYGLVPANPGPHTVMGGCVVRPDSPKYACRSCGHRWGQR